MLLNNYTVINRNTSTNWGIAFTNPMARFRATQLNCFYTGEHVVTGETDRSAFNNGYNGQYAWWPALVAGGIGARSDGSGSATIAIAGGRNATASLDGSGVISNAVGQLVVSAVAALAGTGTCTADIVGKLEAIAALAGTGALTAALDALGTLASTLSGTGAATADVDASGTMEAAIIIAASETNEAIAAAVMAALVDGEFNMKQVLQIIAAATAGKVSGAPGSPVFRNLADSRDVIDGTVDTNGNRSAATYDPEG